MGLNIDQNGNSATITIDTQSLAGDEAGALKMTAVELIEKGITNLSLNLEKPEYMDSSGIGKLLFLNKKLTKMGGIFQITKINQTLFDFLESLAITKVVKINPPE